MFHAAINPGPVRLPPPEAVGPPGALLRSVPKPDTGTFPISATTRSFGVPPGRVSRVPVQLARESLSSRTPQNGYGLPPRTAARPRPFSRVHRAFARGKRARCHGSSAAPSAKRCFWSAACPKGHPGDVRCPSIPRLPGHPRCRDRARLPRSRARRRTRAMPVAHAMRLVQSLACALWHRKERRRRSSRQFF